MLKLLIKKLTPTNGLIEHNEKYLRIGYLDQLTINQFDNNKTLVEIIIDKYNIKYQDAREILSIVKLKSEIHNHLFHTLSGGEKTKFALSFLLFNKPNVLILDEPTNNLDLECIEDLISFLNNDYKGAMIISTHNQYFIDALDNDNVKLICL